MDNNRTSTVPIVPKQYRLPFFMLVSCFALWGLLNNMTDNLVPAFSKIFMINASESAGVQISFYGGLCGACHFRLHPSGGIFL